jgi:hypothetical protein
LIAGPDKEVWAFDYAGQPWSPAGGTATLTRIGPALGQEQRHDIESSVPIGDAAWLSGHRFFLAADGCFSVVDLDQAATVSTDGNATIPDPHLRGTIRIDDRAVLLAARHGSIYRADGSTGQVVPVVRLDALALGCKIARGPSNRAYMLAHRGRPHAFLPLVIALSGY